MTVLVLIFGGCLALTSLAELEGELAVRDSLIPVCFTPPGDLTPRSDSRETGPPVIGFVVAAFDPLLTDEADDDCFFEVTTGVRAVPAAEGTLLSEAPHGLEALLLASILASIATNLSLTCFSDVLGDSPTFLFAVSSGIFFFSGNNLFQSFVAEEPS